MRDRIRRASSVAVTLRAAVAEVLEPRVLLATASLDVADPRDVVFDPSRHLLYIPTGSGKVERFDLNARTMLTPWTVGGSLGGADITPDGASLFVADRTTYTGGVIKVQKIDLASGAVTVISYPRTTESASNDVAIGSDGKAYVTPYGGSDRYQPAVIDTASGSVSRGAVSSYFGPLVSASGDRKTLAFGPGIEGMTAYSVEQQAIIATGKTGGTIMPAVNYDGSLFANQTYNYGLQIGTRTLRGVRNLMTGAAATAFDPTRDVLYVAAGEVVAAYDTATWRKMYTLPAHSMGGMVVDPAGAVLARFATGGLSGSVEILDIPTSDGVARAAQVTNLSSYAPVGRPLTFTVTMRDAAGNVASGYRGTVAFSSSDARATLPTDYTFTESDAGVHTFAVTFRETGVQDLKVGDFTAGSAAPAAVTGATSTTLHKLNAAQVIPVAMTDQVYDPTRGLLYIATSTGNIERYDPVAQQFLTPIEIGMPLKGIDITPDGSRLFVGNAYRSMLDGFLERVDLNDLSVTHLSYLAKPDVYTSDLVDGSYDVAVMQNGRVLFTSLFNGSGNVPMRQYDPATGQISVRYDYGGGSMRMNASVIRGSARGLAYIGDGGYRSTYDPATDTFPLQQVPVPDPYSNSLDAIIDRTDSLIVADGKVYNRSLVFQRNLATTSVAFNPSQDLLYGVDVYNSTGGVVYDTRTWATTSTFQLLDQPLTYNGVPGGDGAISTDARWLFVHSMTGIEVVPLVTRPVITATATTIAPGATQSVTVAARRPDGTNDAAYRGTVRFTTTDPAGTLPSDYTYTATDAGSRAFSFKFNTPGRHTVTATDLATGMVTAMYDVVVTGVAFDANGALGAFGGLTAADTVSAGLAGDTVTVTFNGATSTYPAGSVRRAEFFTQGGNDSVTVGAGFRSVFVDAGAGADSVKVTVASDPRTRLNLVGGTETDGLTITGTAADETITATPTGASSVGAAAIVHTGFENFTVDGGDGNDSIFAGGYDVAASVAVRGGNGNDLISISSGGGFTPAGITYRVAVTGGDGDDRLVLERVASSQVYNMSSFDGGNGVDSVTVYSNGSSYGITVYTTSVASGSMGTTFTTALERIIGIGSASSEAFTINGTSTTPKLSYDSGGGTDSVTLSSGVATLESDVRGVAGGSVDVTVSSGTTLTFASSQHLAQLNVNGTARLAAGGNKVLRATGVSLATAGRLDLTDNDMLIDYAATAASPLGSWTGSTYGGLTGELLRGAVHSSSASAGFTRLGLGEASELLGLSGSASATWSGEAVDATSVLVKYTYAGDANLDGMVTGDDYSSIDFNILVAGSSGWSNGDFNLDGIISGDDYSAIDFAMLAQGAPL